MRLRKLVPVDGLSVPPPATVMSIVRALVRFDRDHDPYVSYVGPIRNLGLVQIDVDRDDVVKHDHTRSLIRVVLDAP